MVDKNLGKVLIIFKLANRSTGFIKLSNLMNKFPPSWDVGFKYFLLPLKSIDFIMLTLT